jgi:predicted DNA-binding protein
MKRASEPNKTISFSLPANLYRVLEKSALEQNHSKNYLLRKATEAYLEDLYFAKKAERILAKNEPTYTIEQITTKYGLSNTLL